LLYELSPFFITSVEMKFESQDFFYSEVKTINIKELDMMSIHLPAYTGYRISRPCQPHAV